LIEENTERVGCLSQPTEPNLSRRPEIVESHESQPRSSLAVAVTFAVPLVRCQRSSKVRCFTARPTDVTRNAATWLKITVEGVGYWSCWPCQCWPSAWTNYQIGYNSSHPIVEAGSLD